MQMEYRRLGKSGVKVSLLSYGSWITFANQMDLNTTVDSMAAAIDYGVNFFDNAEVYAYGQAEEHMGLALKKLDKPRLKYLVSTKFFWGISKGPNEQNTLNRKYLMQAMDQSLRRLQLDFVDLVYCHRPDPFTPIEETVWAMSDMIQAGKALYWGTSEWSASEIMQAWQIADRYNLRKPIVEQPQYNLLHREKVEKEFARLYEDIGLGLTTWSPLASGLLTGKYLNRVPEDSRAVRVKGLNWLMEDELNSPKRREQITTLKSMASDLGGTSSQLALAWCMFNKNVSTVISGSSRIEQLHENMRALELYSKITPEIHEKLSAVFL
jgi:voltage-dependent potassium channel beta subunit